MPSDFPPLLTCVSVVVNQQPALAALTEVISGISAFLDVSLTYKSLAHAAKFDSVELLQRVAAIQEREWTKKKLSSLMVKCYRQWHFTQAMWVLAAHGFLTGAKWLCEVYFPEGKCTFAAGDAAENGHADFLEWVLDMFPDDTSVDRYVLRRNIIPRGFVDVLRVLWEHSKTKHLFAVDNRNLPFSDLHTQVLPFLQTNSIEIATCMAMDKASRTGDLTLMLWLHEHYAEPFTPIHFWNAVCYHHFHVAKYLHTNHEEVGDVTNEILNAGVLTGNLEMFKWLYASRSEEYISVGEGQHLYWGSDKSSDGHWELCKWLHENQLDCKAEFIEIAAVSGNVAMLDWLLEQKPNLFCSFFKQMDYVVRSAPLDVIKWLNGQRYMFTDKHLRYAVKKGKLSIVKWLGEHHPHLLSTSGLLNVAAERGYFEVVEFLHHHHGDVGCSTKAMDKAAENGHFAVVKFLHENRTEGCTTRAMDRALNIKVLDFLHHNRTEGCTKSVGMHAMVEGQLDVLEWLYEHKREMMDLNRMRCHAERFHIRYWLDAIAAETK